MTDLETQLDAMGIKPSRFAEMLGRDVRTVRRWCRDGAPIEVRALLRACGETTSPLPPRLLLEALLACCGGDCEPKSDPETLSTQEDYR